jgi:protein SCO1/2
LPLSACAQRYNNSVLRTHEDRPVRFYDDLLKGKQVIVNFMYASCQGACPLVTSKLIKVHQALEGRMGRDLFIYSITLKPEQDDQAALKRFAEKHRALLPGWTFLTGDQYDLETVRFNLFRWDHLLLDLDLDLHASKLRIVNEATNRWFHVSPHLGLDSILKVISRADPPRSFKDRLEESNQIQKRIDEDVKRYGYRRTV